MSAAAKLSAALRKQADDSDVPPPPPLAPCDPGASQLKLKKSNLLGAVTWDDVANLLAFDGKHDFDEMAATATKMFLNVLANPAEPKYRKVRASNKNFDKKVYSCKGAPELFRLAGFRNDVEEGFLVLPEAAESSAVQRAVDALAAATAARGAAEEKKRNEEAAARKKARAERQRAKEEAAAPEQFDAAAAGAAGAMVDEDEAMVEAVEEHFERHPEVRLGRDLDNFEIERQVPGPKGSVVASVVASAGTKYFDYVAYMTRSQAGEWSVQKVEGS